MIQHMLLKVTGHRNNQKQEHSERSLNRNKHAIKQQINTVLLPVRELLRDNERACFILSIHFTGLAVISAHMFYKYTQECSRTFNGGH